MNKFYDGTKILSLKDLNGMDPEIYMITSNRSGGKTTFFNRMEVNRFKKTRKKFGLLYRFNYELDNVDEKFFKDIAGLFFPKDTFRSKRMASGIYHELFLNDEPCGYALTLNSADQIKKNSHLFSDLDSYIFDEFQSETGHYCDKEVEKFRNIHTSIARGGGKQVRRVPVYMLSNPVTLLNPYYTAMHIGARLQKDTNFLRGNGWVLEQGFVSSASLAQKESAFNRAFSGDQYDRYNTEAVYLDDNMSFVGRPKGRAVYICTILYMGNYYGLKEYREDGIMYVDSRPDMDCQRKLTVTTDDHRINYVMLKRNDMFLQNMRYLFEHGAFRFAGLAEKDALISALGYY